MEGHQVHYQHEVNRWFLFQHLVLDKQLYIRGQQWCLLSPHERVMDSYVCEHLGTSVIYPAQNRFRRMTECRVRHEFSETSPCIPCSPGMVSCSYCPTEACVDIKRFDGEAVVVVTKWMRIGDGWSRLDVDWSRRLPQAEPQLLDAINSFSYQWGSLRAVFGIKDAHSRSRLLLTPAHERQMLDVVLQRRD